MRPRRAVRRLLDPWAGLLYAALIVLGVVILSATPAPWRAVGGEEAPVTLAAEPPSDLAVFVLSGPVRARCTAVVWLHVEHDPAALSAILVPAPTLCPVPGGGYAPIRRLVTDTDPAVATAALGVALGVDLDGWATLDRAAAVRLLGAAREGGSGREGRPAVKAAVIAFSAPADGVADLRRQREGLARSLRGVDYSELKANAVVNYALGSGEVATDLDLRAASTLATTFRSLDGPDVAVGVAPAVVQRCGAARAWRLDEARLEPLRLSLALGLRPPAAPPRIAVRERAPEVLVVAPPLLRGDALADDLRAALDAGGARPVAVHSVSLGGDDVARQLSTLLARRRPLAVVLVPSVVGSEAGSAAAGRLTAMTEVLLVARQPAVIVGSSAQGDEVADAAGESGLPIVTVEEAPAAATLPPAPGTLFAFDAARRSAARLIAATVSRACWPEYLAPSLRGTRLEFSYAARRAATVAATGDGAGELAGWLSACGYDVDAEDGAGWAPPPAPTIAYQAGGRRAALALAGDLGWVPATLAVDASAPAELAVVTGLE